MQGVLYQKTMCGHFSLSPLLSLPSLRAVKLDMVLWQCGKLDPLLELPALQLLDLSMCIWMLRGERSDQKEEEELHRLMRIAEERGITLVPWL